jgi:hypothetical protein
LQVGEQGHHSRAELGEIVVFFVLRKPQILEKGAENVIRR